MSRRPKDRQMKPTRKPTNMGGRGRQRDVGEIQHGTVGWEDGGDHFDLASEGVPLLKVTLFAGYNTETQGLNTEPTRARGMQILARFDGKSSDIPNDGELVIVARPAGTETMPGAYYVIGRPMPDPKWIPNRKSGEKLVQGPNDSFWRVKEDGTQFHFVKSGDDEKAPPVFTKLARDGWQVRHPHGRARADAMGWEMAHSSGAKIVGGSVAGMPAPLDALSSYVAVQAALIKLEAAVVAIGNDAAGPDNVMKAIPTVAMFTAIQAALSTMTTLLGTICASAQAAPNPGLSIAAATAAQLGLVVASVGASGSAVTAIPVTGPTKTLTAG